MHFNWISSFYFVNFLFGLTHGRPTSFSSVQQSQKLLSGRVIPDPRRDCGYLPAILRRVNRVLPNAQVRKSVNTNFQRRVQSSTTINHWCLLSNSTTETYNSELWNGTEVRLEFNVLQSYLQNMSQAKLTFLQSSLEDELESTDFPEITVQGTVSEEYGISQNLTFVNITSVPDQLANRHSFNVLDFLNDVSNMISIDPNANFVDSFITIVFFIRQPCSNERCNFMLNLDLHTPSLRICNVNHSCDL